MQLSRKEEQRIAAIIFIVVGLTSLFGIGLGQNTLSGIMFTAIGFGISNEVRGWVVEGFKKVISSLNEDKSSDISAIKSQVGVQQKVEKIGKQIINIHQNKEEKE